MNLKRLAAVILSMAILAACSEKSTTTVSTLTRPTAEPVSVEATTTTTEPEPTTTTTEAPPTTVYIPPTTVYVKSGREEAVEWYGQHESAVKRYATAASALSRMSVDDPKGAADMLDELVYAANGLAGSLGMAPSSLQPEAAYAEIELDGVASTSRTLASCMRTSFPYCESEMQDAIEAMTDSNLAINDLTTKVRSLS